MAKNDVRFYYTNWRDETRRRRVRPEHFYFGATEYHPEPQWLMRGRDLDRNVQQTFAMKAIKDWTPDTDGK